MRLLLAFLILFAGSLFGQVVQYGRVVESDDPERCLTGVAITVPSEHDCQPTMSDSEGRFRLCFRLHHVGDVIQGLEVKKKDYEVVNVHVTRRWTLTDNDTLSIIMAPKKKVKEARSRYYELSDLWKVHLFDMEGWENLVEVESPIFRFNISRYHKGVVPSDVDEDLPQTIHVDDRTFVVVVANEDYQREQDVPFAIHDGEVFKEYCVQVLGIPENNIHLKVDATLNDLRFEVDWLKNALQAYQGESRAIFYYSGHGIPDEISRSSYLLPVDGYASNLESSYSLDQLYAELGDAGAGMVLYFVDACFSGANRDGGMLVESRGVAIDSRAGTLQGNSVAFTAAQGHETANNYKEKSHGLFTYFLLKKLKENSGMLTVGELADYLNENVIRVSSMELLKTQHPSATASQELEEWRKINIK